MKTIRKQMMQATQFPQQPGMPMPQGHMMGGPGPGHPMPQGMPMHPGVYADLLSNKMAEHDSTAWLINTGWSGGSYGVGNRMKIKYTRAMLNAALDGDLDDVEYIVDDRFGFEIPKTCPGVPSEVLIPKQTWEDGNAYDATADKLASMFNENFKRYSSGVSDEVNSAAPTVA